MSYELFDVDKVTVGTVGPPGKRVFLLQARSGGTVVTLKIEKQQVAALAQYLAEILSDLASPGDLPTDLELDEPAEPDWVIGALGVTYDEATDRVLLVAEEAVGEEGDDVGEVARLAATREQIAALAIRGVQLVEAGRPPCPLCGFPLDPSGHVCPRTNGHRPPTP
jgi:uncharacterized repeat protein (TIGR03847 family)